MASVILILLSWGKPNITINLISKITVSDWDSETPEINFIWWDLNSERMERCLFLGEGGLRKTTSNLQCSRTTLLCGQGWVLDVMCGSYVVPGTWTGIGGIKVKYYKPHNIFLFPRVMRDEWASGLISVEEKLI